MKKYSEMALADLIPFPADDANKYTRGKLTLVAGSRAYPGAAGLAAMASQRAGAGYTEVYVDDAGVRQVRAYRPSLVVRSWADWDESSVAPSTDHHPCAYAIGSGFDAQDPSAPVLVRRLLQAADAPVLVDGGALKLLSVKKIRELCVHRRQQGKPTVVTPHMGEAASMAEAFDLNTSDQMQLAVDLARSYGVIAVLKGPDTCISDGDATYRMTEGTSALSKAGTGDVLAGIVGALLAQGLDPFGACVLGTTMHARAGILAEQKYGMISVCAEDLIELLPQTIIAMARNRSPRPSDIQSD